MSENEDKLKKIVEWTKLKLKIHLQEKNIFYFYEREIWWTSIGSNIGCEQDGKNDKFERPILVLKKFNSTMLWALPLTSKQKQGEYFYYIDDNEKKYTFILPQLRLISSKRLIRKMSKISVSNFNIVKSVVIKYI